MMPSPTQVKSPAQSVTQGLLSLWNKVIPSSTSGVAPTSIAHGELQFRLLQELARRGVYWIAFVLAANAAIALTALLTHTARARPPFNLRLPNLMSIPVWFGGLCLLAIAGMMLARATARLGKTTAATTVRRYHLGWALFATVMSVWWGMGLYALMDQPPKADQFIVAQRTFLWLCALGHVVSLVLLSSSWEVLLAVLVLGFYLPSYAFWNALPEFPYVSVYWLSGQVGTYFIVALFLYFNQKDLLLKQISLETERERADDLLHQKNNMLASFSHDFRQPLTALALKLDSLKAQVFDDKAKSAVVVAESQVDAMAAMINTALDLSRLEAGQYPVEKREIAVRGLLEEVMHDFHDDAAKKNIRLRLFCPPFLAFSDRDALFRIVSNLVSNALKYTCVTEGRAGSVLIGCQRRGAELRVSVVDNGIGIPPAQRSNIFKEYIQLANPERDRRKGVGLGLSIVKALAELLDHRLEVESAVAKGSRFSVSIPYVGKVPREYLQQTAPLSNDAPDFAGMVVLLVEDNLILREELSAKLRDWGCYVIAADTADALIDALPQVLGDSQPDLLISDYRLPESKTGIEAIRAVRQIYANLPAAIWTGEVTSGVVKEVADQGLRFLSKPSPKFDLIDLLATYWRSPDGCDPAIRLTG